MSDRKVKNKLDTIPMGMSNQAMLDYIEDGFPPMSIGLREKVLDAVWNALVDNRREPQWMEEDTND